MILTSEQKSFYADNGYLLVPGMVAADVLAELRSRIDAIQNGASAATQGAMYEQGATATAARPALRKLSFLATHDAFFRGVASTPKILDTVAELTGGAEHVSLYADQAMLKPAFHGSEKPLHQDNSYFRVTPMDFGVTCWLAIDDATVENGCLHYIPGSHKLGLIPHRQIPDTPHLVPEDESGLAPLVACPVPAGWAVFHHLLTLHNSGANNSVKSRRGWAMHYINAAVDPVDEKRRGQVLALR